MQFSTIKSQVLASLAASTASQVKDWAERHGLNVDLRTKAGWQQVLEAIAVQLKPAAEQAIVAVRNADYGQLKQDAFDKALQLKVAAVDGALDAHAILKQHWGPSLRLAWDIARLIALWTAIAAIYCLHAGQRTRAFISEFEDTGYAPHQIAWCLAKPLAKRARKLGYVMRDRLQVWALNRVAEVKRLARLRRAREAVAYAVVSFASVATTGLIG